MKKVQLLALSIIILGIFAYLGNTYLHGGGEVGCLCTPDNPISLSCDTYCSKRGSYCTGYCLTTSECHGDLCNHTWQIYCKNDASTVAGGVNYCADCEEDQEAPSDINGPFAEDPTNPNFTPLDASGNPMW